jgi:hypothetical protein
MTKFHCWRLIRRNDIHGPRRILIKRTHNELYTKMYKCTTFKQCHISVIKHDGSMAIIT